MTDIQATAVLVSQGDTDIAFRSWRQVLRWFDETIEGWSWLSTVPGSDPAAIRSYIPSRLNAARGEVVTAMNSGQPLTDLNGIFARHMSDGYAAPHPKTDAAKTVFEIRDIAGPEAGMFAFGINQKLLNFGSIQSNDQWRGMSLATSPELLFAAGEASRLKRERSSYRAAADKLFADIGERETRRDLEWRTATESLSRTASDWAEKLTRRWLRTSLKARARERSAIDKLHATDVTFTEKMALKAPVEYWEKKAAKHQTAEGVMQAWLWVYFPLAFLCLVGMFGGVGYYLLTTPATALPPGLTVVASAGLATAAGMLFWVGRLLTKLYLSQHHLRQDAEERATMTTTYLALTEVSAPGDADRQIVLNALFRSTPDGIVKEEGGLDPNLASALGRFLAR